MTKYLRGATPRRKLLFWPLASEGSQSTERERSDRGADQSIVGAGPAVSVVEIGEAGSTASTAGYRISGWLPHILAGQESRDVGWKRDSLQPSLVICFHHLLKAL